MNKTYSYHTFLFPFLWNDGSVVLREKFVRCLGERWECESAPTGPLSDARMNEMYNQYHYFNAAARHAVYAAQRTVDAVVWEYRYRLDEGTRYVIEKGERRAALAVDAIRLKLYNTGIGILLFELRNDTHPATEDILWINDFGRGIYMPFCDNGECSGCADEISLVRGESVLAGGKLVGCPASYDALHLAAPIAALLQSDDYRITTDETKKDKKTFFIEPIIDDRMFAACYCVAPELVGEATAWTDGDYRYLRDAATRSPDDPDNVAATLYRLVFVDGAGLTCQNRGMLAEAMQKNLYTRWLEYGTFIGITDYSLTAISSSDADYLVRNFRTEYVEMAALTLAQRASLLGFERMISDSALGRRDISRIQRRYLMFQSQLLLKEVTSQQQGLELYRHLREKMFIAEQAGDIREQITALFEQKTNHNEMRENRILFFLAILGIMEAVDLFVGWLLPNAAPFVKPLIALGMCAAVTLYTFCKRK